jgi:hypothetical protein
MRANDTRKLPGDKSCGKEAKNIQLSGKEAMTALVLTQGMRAVERRQDSSHPLASL